MKKYTEEREIWADFEAMVASETEDAARAIAEAMPVKVLRKIWEYKAPAYLTSDPKGLGLWKMLKSEWVEEVVNVARDERARRVSVAGVRTEVVAQPVEAPASDAVTAVKAAETADAIEAVLKTCTKAEMLRVFSECTDGKYSISKSWKKAEIAHRVAVEVERTRAREAFRALTLEEKYEYLTSQTNQREVDKMFWSMTEAEFLEIARRLGIDATDAYVVSKTMEELQRITNANRASRDIVSEYNGMVESLMEKSESELRAEIRDLCESDDITGYMFEGCEHWSKGELVRELADWYLFNSPDVDDGLTSVYYEKGDALAEESPAEVSDAVSEAVKVIKSDAPYAEKYELLLQCSDPEMFKVMKACTGGRTKLGTDYDSHEELASKVLERIGEEVSLDVAV